jgi:hypothetical protein
MRRKKCVYFYFWIFSCVRTKQIHSYSWAFVAELPHIHRVDSPICVTVQLLKGAELIAANRRGICRYRSARTSSRVLGVLALSPCVTGVFESERLALWRHRLCTKSDVTAQGERCSHSFVAPPTPLRALCRTQKVCVMTCVAMERPGEVSTLL